MAFGLLCLGLSGLGGCTHHYHAQHVRAIEGGTGGKGGGGEKKASKKRGLEGGGGGGNAFGMASPSKAKRQSSEGGIFGASQGPLGGTSRGLSDSSVFGKTAPSLRRDSNPLGGGRRDGGRGLGASDPFKGL